MCARVNIRHLKHTHTATPPPPSTFAFRRCRRRNPAGVYALRSRARNWPARRRSRRGDSMRCAHLYANAATVWPGWKYSNMLCCAGIGNARARPPARILMCISCCTSTTVCNCVSCAYAFCTRTASSPRRPVETAHCSRVRALTHLQRINCKNLWAPACACVCVCALSRCLLLLLFGLSFVVDVINAHTRVCSRHTHTHMSDTIN